MVLALPDACGTGELTTTPPLERQTGAWTSPVTTQVFSDAPAADVAASPTSLTSRIDTYADDADAAAAAAVLRTSVATCALAPGASRPTYPVVREVFLADAFFGAPGPAASGQYSVTALHVSGRRTATVTAVVAGVRDQQAREEVATQVAWLAADAASRAGSPAWLTDGSTDGPVTGSPVTTAEVQQLLPGAQAAPAVGMHVPPLWESYDACGTTPLTGLADAQDSRRTLFLDPELGYVDFQIGGRAPTAMGLAAVVVTTSDFGTPAAARAYATVFRDSASTCTSGSPLTEVDGTGADVLLSTAFDAAPHRYWHAAVVVRGGTAATVLARVPGTADEDSGARAAQRTVDLATAAAERAADQAAAGSGDAP